LRGVEEGQHHSLVLKKADKPGLCYIGFRVRRPEELENVVKVSQSLGLKYKKFKERGVSDAILIENPSGMPMLFYYDMEYVGDLRMKFYAHRGVVPIRLAHVNYVVENLEVESKFLTNVLGFYETERYLDKEGKPMVLWFTRRGNSHEIAVSQSKNRSPGYHHQSYYVHDIKDVIRAADILASAELWDSIERGPGRHGATQGYYIYLRDLDKNRIEFFTADYEVLDPDKWKPVVWSYEQFRYRSDFWGRPIPESWLNEWVSVEDIETGELKRWKV